jgi:hypothetical protein
MMVEGVLSKIRRRLDKHGFKEVKMMELEGDYGWVKTSVKEPQHRHSLEPTKRARFFSFGIHRELFHK